jgi:DNA-binding protein H-NS
VCGICGGDRTSLQKVPTLDAAHTNPRSSTTSALSGSQRWPEKFAEAVNLPTRNNLMIQDLLKQKADLEAQIEALKKEHQADAIKQCKEIIASHDLTADQLFGKKVKQEKPAGIPKYTDPATGKTWTGRGRQPNWFKTNDMQALSNGNASY